MFQRLSRAQGYDDRQFIGYSMVHINSACTHSRNLSFEESRNRSSASIVIRCRIRCANCRDGGSYSPIGLALLSKGYVRFVTYGEETLPTHHHPVPKIYIGLRYMLIILDIQETQCAKHLSKLPQHIGSKLADTTNEYSGRTYIPFVLSLIHI